MSIDQKKKTTKKKTLPANDARRYRRRREKYRGDGAANTAEAARTGSMEEEEWRWKY